MLALLATILLIALAFMLPIGLTVFLAVRFVFALTIIKRREIGRASCRERV